MSDDYQVLNLFGQECDAGWGYDARIRCFIPKDQKIERFGHLLGTPKQLNGHCLVDGDSLSSLTFDFHSESESSYSQMMKKLFGNCRDFIEAIVDRNENVCNLIEFLMKNRENIGSISHVTNEKRRNHATNTNFPNATHFVEYVHFGTRMLIIFDGNNVDLLENGDKKNILDKIWKKKQDLTENQEKIVCQVLIFSQKTTKIGEFTMKKILEMISEPESSIPLSCEMKSLPGKSSNLYFKNFKHYDMLTNQIFEIYWIKKLLEDEVTDSFMDQFSELSMKDKLPEGFAMKKEKMSNLEKITNAWNQKIQQCTDLLDRKDVSMYDLWSTFPMEGILEMKKQMKAANVDSFAKV
uniref:Uncharacterized protein n=1 Tax=Panagrolaimus sp. JU765 TaxID=591449 RepID=A0AC34RHX1_9BILA